MYNLRSIKEALLKSKLRHPLTPEELSRYILCYNGMELDESKTVKDLDLVGYTVECKLKGFYFI